jgi:predicted house-cleaning noncanonical NTP pyrophosphatase (MazG superfamily)
VIDRDGETTRIPFEYEFQYIVASLPDMAREYDKLVRDEIPRIIEADGETPVVHVADDEEYERRLHEKLDEEVAEYRDNGHVEELADVLEVVHALRELEDVSAERLDDVRAAKATECGRFEERVVLDRVE